MAIPRINYFMQTSRTLLLGYTQCTPYLQSPESWSNADWAQSTFFLVLLYQHIIFALVVHHL